MRANPDEGQQRPSLLKRIVPILDWLPNYNKKNLRFDGLAAVTVAAFSVPESLAYAGLAGLPPQAGLYAGMAAPIAYALFGTSRQLGIGATSALSILVASSLGVLAANDPDKYAALAAMLAIIVGGLCLIAWIAKLGFLVNFISESVLIGFSAGAALYISSTQLGKLLGIEGSSGEFFERIWYFIKHIDETSGWTLAVGFSAIVVLLIGERVAAKIPWSLVVVLAGILLIALTNLESRGVSIVGDIPSGLPAPRLPDLGLHDISPLLGPAMAVFLLAYVEGMGGVQTFARKHHYRADANQELLALGAANAASGIFQAFPVGGSLSRSAVQDNAGAKTPLAGLGVGVLVGAVALFLTGLFSDLPEAVLGAVVIVAVRGLFNVPALRRLYDLNRSEFQIAVAAFAGVLLFGMLDGVLIGAALSILILVWRASRPHTVRLGRIPSSNSYSDIARHPENEVDPDVLLYRADGELFYANTSQVRDDLLRMVDTPDQPPKLVVFDLSVSPAIDLTTVEMLTGLHDDLRGRGITLRLANVEGPVRDLLRRAEPELPFGELTPDDSIDTVVTRWRTERQAVPTST